MRELKIRYTYKRKEDGKIYQEIVPVECLEGRGDRPFALDIHNPYWDIIARDLFTGLKDKNGKDIYEGDILKSLDGFLGLVEMNNACWDANFKKGTGNVSWPLSIHGYLDEIVCTIYENPGLLSPRSHRR